jgi:hypothetical protein
MRETPLRERKQKKVLEADDALRQQTAAQFPVPAGEPAFREGYRECVQMFALHVPNKRQVGKILDEYCINLENVCISQPTRENYAIYEGYRQAMKDLKRMRKIR